MDSNGGGGWPMNNTLPVGFGVALSMNQNAMENYSKLTEAEKEQLIARSYDAKSDKDVEEIINSLI